MLRYMNDLNKNACLKSLETIIRLYVRLEKTVTEMWTGCFRMMKVAWFALID